MTDPASIDREPRLLYEMLAAIEHVEAVYRLNCVAPGEPSSTLENLERIIGKARAALSSTPQGALAAPPLFQQMVNGFYAEVKAQRKLEEILGVELLGISFDDYDSSFEIFEDEESTADIVPTSEQHAAIIALGCRHYWINFKDGTERYCTNDRKATYTNRWDSFNHRVLVKSAALATQGAQGAEPVDDEWLDTAYEGLCTSCESAGEVPPTLPTFVRGLIGMLAPTMSAAPPAALVEQPSDHTDLLQRLEQFVSFLCGAAELDGASFGDRLPSPMGAYWWRTSLRTLEKEIFAALAAHPVRESPAVAAPQTTFEAWAKANGFGQSMATTWAQQGWNAALASQGAPAPAVQEKSNG